MFNLINWLTALNPQMPLEAHVDLAVRRPNEPLAVLPAVCSVTDLCPRHSWWLQIHWPALLNSLRPFWLEKHQCVSLKMWDFISAFAVVGRAFTTLWLSPHLYMGGGSSCCEIVSVHDGWSCVDSTPGAGCPVSLSAKWPLCSGPLLLPLLPKRECLSSVGIYLMWNTSVCYFAVVFIKCCRDPESC